LVKDADYNRTLMRTKYKIPLVVGLVSFARGVECGTEIPSVYTYLPYFKDWIRSVMETN
jgi:secreted trypsin-like serine protease